MATPRTIAVAGKGGVGKTTTCGMIIDYLCRQKKGPILVVDADANSNLNEVLGVEADVTLGQIREEMAHAEQTGSIPAGMPRCSSTMPSSKRTTLICWSWAAPRARAAIAMSTAS